MVPYFSVILLKSTPVSLQIKGKESRKHAWGMCLNTSLMLTTGFPSNSVTTSPGWNPARSPGDPGVT